MGIFPVARRGERERPIPATRRKWGANAWPARQKRGRDATWPGGAGERTDTARSCRYRAGSARRGSRANLAGFPQSSNVGH
ncbi:protein of unknown function [Burkholderia multivorans]